jgi:hypothetical protein
VSDIGRTRDPIPPWDRREVPGLFDVESAARRLGHYKWFEMRLFEVLGRWTALTPEHDVKARLGRNSAHHAWHAELFHRRLPELADLHPAGLTVPPNEAMAEFVEALSAPTDPGSTLERLVGVYRVAVPWAASAYTFHLHRASGVADAPTMRSLELVLTDLTADVRDGEMLVQSFLIGPDDVDRAVEHQRALERLMVATGGIAGPGSAG